MLRYKNIFLGNQCNNKCLYCPYRQKDPVQLDFKTIIDALEGAEEDSVAFYGGEPTQRSDFLDVIHTAKKKGYKRIKLITHGRAFSDIQALLQILNAGCQLFEIKLWGSNPSIHDFITQVPGSFLETIQGLENLQRLSFEKFICLRIPICRQNYTDLINTVATGIGTRVNRIILSLQDPNLSFKKLLPHIKNAVNISTLNRIWIMTEGLPFCVMQDLEHHISEIYYGHDYISYDRTYRQHKYCKDCIYQELCHGVEVEYLNRFGEKEFPPLKEGKYLRDIKSLYG